MPARFQRINTGVSRFANLVLGLAIDRSGGVPMAREVSRRLREGGAFVATTCFFGPRPDGSLPSPEELEALSYPQASYMGEVALGADNGLTVQCEHGGQMSSRMTYRRRRDGAFRPTESYWKSKSDITFPLRTQPIPDRYWCPTLAYESPVPPELRPAFDMNVVEQLIAPQLGHPEPDYVVKASLLTP
jgi:hypothetical protein